MLETIRSPDDEAAAAEVLSALQAAGRAPHRPRKPNPTAVRQLVEVIASVRAALDGAARHADKGVDLQLRTADDIAHVVEAKSATPSDSVASRSPRAMALEASALRLLGRLFSGDTRAYLVHLRDPSLQPAMARAVSRMAELLEVRRRELSNANINGLVDQFLGDDPIRTARENIEWSNAHERTRYLKETLTLTSEQVAELVGHKAGNQSAAASRFKSRGAVFSVSAKGRELYPAFQFQDGRPRPVIRRILEALPDEMTSWQRAFWFEAANGWLDGDAPADRLNDEDLVVEAARREGEPTIG